MNPESSTQDTLAFIDFLMHIRPLFAFLQVFSRKTSQSDCLVVAELKNLQKSIMELSKDINPEMPMKKVFISKRVSRETQTLLDGLNERLYSLCNPTML